MRRSIAVDPLRKRPAWSDDERAPLVAASALAGAWTTSGEDLRALERLVASDWKEIEPAVREASRGDDPLFRQVGDTWMVVSPEDAYLLLQPALSRSILEAWFKEAEQILLEPDPILDLSAEERLSAQMLGQRTTISNTMKGGIAESTALMGVMGDGDDLDATYSVASLTRHRVTAWLRRANDDASGRTWRLMAPRLDRFAEAAPEEFLDAIEDDLQTAHPVLLTLFREEDESMSVFGSASLHHHLLWALETLCWSQDHLVTAVRLLARLCTIDPGGKSSNRPLASLSTVLCGWTRQTGANLTTRLAALDAVCDISDDTGWALIQELWPDHHGWVMPPSSPRYRVGWKPTSTAVTMTEWASFVHELVVRAMPRAAGNGQRLGRLVEKMSAVPPADRDAILDLLQEQISSGVLSADAQLDLWEQLQSVAARHRRFPNADWSMSTDALTKLEALATAARPERDPLRFAHLFDWRPDLNEVDNDDYVAYDRRLEELRLEAIQQIMDDDRNWLAALEALAERVKAPTQLGFVLAGAEGIELASIAPWLSSEIPAVREAAARFMWRRLLICGDTALRTGLQLDSLEAEARALFLRCVPPEMRFWSELDKWPTDADYYWENTPIEVVPVADVEKAVEYLLHHGRAWTAIAVLSHALHPRQSGEPSTEDVPMPSAALIAQVLTVARGQAPKEIEFGQMTGYYLGELLDRLVSDGEPDDLVAGFEYAFFRLLEHHRATPRLDALLATNPEMFVQLVTLSFRGKDEPKKEKSEADANIASHAFWVLRAWTGCPGLANDGTIDRATLDAWIAEARLKLSESDRGDIGDEVMGETFGHSPAGADGIWPAEPVRDVVERIGSREFENGLVIGRLNSRGVTSRDVFEGGRQERTLAETYREWSKALKQSAPRTARVLKRIAESYDRDARRQDITAELDADGLW